MNLSLSRMASSWFAFWVALIAVGVYFLLPIRNNIRFGIDLVGGTYITLAVQVDKAVESALLGRQEDLINRLKDGGKSTPKKHDVVDGDIVLSFSSINDAQDSASFIKGIAQDMRVDTSGQDVRIHFLDAALKNIKRDAVQRNIEVLHTRLNKLGTSEISIAQKGERNIVVELPDVDDPQQAKAMIGTSAILEFKIIEKSGSSPEDILFDYDGDMPGGMEIVSGRQPNEYYLVPKFSSITGKDLTDASAQYDQSRGTMAVGFKFTPEGGSKFYKMTSKNKGRLLAAVLDGVVVTAATINEGIRNSGQITGNFNTEAARELALLLKSGAFVAPVTFEEERQIGPTLGEASIKQGFISCLVGLGLLFLFSLFYYKVSGFFAFLALIYNLVLVLIGLSWVGATLTLPGIAGMVLTIGMAVDASILIFERIKEELAGGSPVRKAVEVGFSDAMRVILDANITTFIVGLVLYYFGTGPIQGFAVTMMLGIVSTLITGLFFLRSLFMFVLDNFKVQKLRI